MDKKDKLIEQANVYKAGDSGVDHDEASFWVWEFENRDLGFILEQADKKITCIEPRDIWHMDTATAKTCRIIDITEDYCPECKFRDKCSKTDIIEEIKAESIRTEKLKED